MQEHEHVVRLIWRCTKYEVAAWATVVQRDILHTASVLDKARPVEICSSINPVALRVYVHLTSNHHDQLVIKLAGPLCNGAQRLILSPREGKAMALDPVVTSNGADALTVNPSHVIDK